MMNFQKVEKDELASALFDGENLEQGTTELSDESKEHLQNYSLIGATLRSEMPKEVNLDFASNLMAKIKDENIKPDVVDQSLVSQEKNFNVKALIKKVSFGFAQIAMAASVAAVTIIGYQTYSVHDGLENEVSSTATLGNVGSANLASYQTNQAGKDLELNKKVTPSKEGSVANNLELKKQQELEVERINTYIRGYVFDTASK